MRFATLAILPFLGTALGAANLGGPWDIELDENGPNSCHPWKDNFEKAYQEAAVMAIKARDDIRAVAGQQRPKRTRASLSRLINWDRISRNMNVCFGFGPDFQGNMDEDLKRQVDFVWDKMTSVFEGDVNNPENGYTGHKPAIACGDKGWKYIAPDDDSPDQSPAKPLREAHPEFASHGAFYWKGRLAWYPTSTPESIGFCRRGVAGISRNDIDVVTFCEPLLNTKDPKWVVDSKESIKRGDSLDDFGVKAMSRTIIHEFAHYHGFGGFETGNTQRVIDYQGLNAKGDRYYITPDGLQKTLDPGPKENENPKYRAYFFAMVRNLARNYDRPLPDGEKGPLWGPKAAVTNAESFAYFALMSYLDNWDWTTKGQAMALPTGEEELHSKRSLNGTLIPIEFHA